MAINLAGTANSFTEFIKGVGAELGISPSNSGSLYPTNFGVKDIRLYDKTAWNKLPFPYTISVEDAPGQSSDQFAPFELPLAPNNINQEEIPASSIQASQGGTVVSRSGIKYKMLNISGTTGIAPFRGMAGVDKTTGEAIAKPKELKYKSGHEVFLTFRNYIKAFYAATSQDPVKYKNARLVWKNYKDGEFFVVELIKFSMKRTAERSFLYDYDIQFKVLKELNLEAPAKSDLQLLDERLNSAIQKIDTARGIFLSSQELLRTVESSYNSTVIEPLRKISLATKAFVGVAITAADIGNRIVKNTVTAAGALSILSTIKAQKKAARTGSDSTIPQSIKSASLPNDLDAAVSNRGADTITDLNEALLDIPADDFPEATITALSTEVEEVSDLQRSFYSNAVEDLKRIKANAEDAFNLGSDEYDEIFDRTATLSAESIKQTTLAEYDLLRAFNDSITAINIMISSQDLFKSDFKSRIDGIQNSFNDALGLESLPAVQSIVLPSETDLERLALVYLGAATRWVEIAELNDLKYPYIVQDLTDTRSNVKRPGEVILIPQNNVFGFAEIEDTIVNKLTSNLNSVEKSLGVDLKVSTEYDLTLTNSGDLNLVAGTQNLAQAVVLKFGYEKGEVINHPTLGVGIKIGSKFTSLIEIRDNVITSLSQDPRIDSIEDLALLRRGSELRLSFSIKIKNVDQPIPLTIRI